MSKAKYENDCKGCEPAAMDMMTKTTLPEGHPVSIGMAVAWARCGRKTREAWHAFTCLSSKRPKDIRLVDAFRADMDLEIRRAHDRQGAYLLADPKKTMN